MHHNTHMKTLHFFFWHALAIMSSTPLFPSASLNFPSNTCTHSVYCTQCLYVPTYQRKQTIMTAAVTAHCNSDCTQPQRTHSAEIVNWHKRPVLLLASSNVSQRQGAQKVVRRHVATNIVYWMALR